MGFLKYNGELLTWNSYNDPEKVKFYKTHGLEQFLSVYKNHKDRFIPMKDLKWGEEMEYVIYKIPDNSA